MFVGFLLIAVTGLIWTAVGIIYSRAVQAKNVFYGFMLVYSLVFFSVIWITRTPSAAPVGEVLKTAAAIIPASTLGLLGFLALFVAMRKGSHGIAWLFTQSAIIVPFFGGWLCFSNQVKSLNLFGMAVIVAALIMVGKSKGSNNASGGVKWSILAMILVGSGQFLTLVPGETGIGDAALSWRLPLAVIPGVVTWSCVAVLQKQLPDKKILKLGVLYGIVVAIGQVTLFMSIDQLGKYSISNIVYPAAISICIVLFSLFCCVWRKEKFSKLSIAGILFLTCGTALLFC